MTRPSGKPGAGEIDGTPGIGGGPGPTPPGVEDGIAVPRRAEPEAPARPSADQQAEAEAAERSAGTRRADIPALSREREGRGAEGKSGTSERERRTRR